MLVYFDESYAQKNQLILGALFLPSKGQRMWLHRSFLKIKKDAGYTNSNGSTKEIKYNYVTTPRKLEIAKTAIDLFFKGDDSYFRACVVPYDEKQLDLIGKQKGVPRKLKEAMLYTHATCQLIKNNIPDVRSGSFIMDELTRAKGDRFDELIRDKLGTGKNAIFRHITYTKSCEDRNHIIQICDLLLGSILNEHYPTKNPYKNDLREYVKKRLGLPSLKRSYWGQKTQTWSETNHPKYFIRFWKVPYKDII